MTGLYLTDMANWLRGDGLEVIEQNGWQTRARGSGGYTGGKPWCVMWHHTASNPSSDGQNDVNYIISAQDAPLANLYINRAGVVWVIAAGATNTNGKGGPWPTSHGTVAVDSMNTAAVGIEVANNGVGERWPQVQVDAFFKVSNCINRNCGNLPTDIATHAEWAPSRKIDPAQGQVVEGPWVPRDTNSSGTWNGNDVRDECQRRAAPAPIPTPPTPTPTPGSDEMAWTRIVADQGNAAFLGWSSEGLCPQVEWVDGFNADQVQRMAAYESTGKLLDMKVDLSAFKNITLFGPIPIGDGLMAQNGLEWTRASFGNVIP